MVICMHMWDYSKRIDANNMCKAFDLFGKTILILTIRPEIQRNLHEE